MKYQELFPVPVEWVQETDEQMAQTVSQWAEAEVKAGRLEHREDYDTLLEPAMRKLMVDLGLGSMLMPDGSGGGGMTTPDAAVTAVVCLELAGYADTGIGFVCANTLALQSSFAIEPNVEAAVLEETAPLFCSDGLNLAGLVLPGYGAGKDHGAFLGMEYQASCKNTSDQELHAGAEVEVTGTSVRPQCCGANGSLFGIVCGLDGAPALAIVPSTAEGLKASEPFLKTGLAPSINADLYLDGAGGTLVFRGEERTLGLLSWYYMACAAVCAGSLLASYEILKEWGDTRVIKGKGQVFKENPLTAALMGEVAGRCGAIRILVFSLARMLARPDLYGPAGSPHIFATATSVFKQASRGAMLGIDNAMELMASAGYATEWNLERYWRDVKTIETYVVPETCASVNMARHYYGLKAL
ncbi:MAG: acyl-CoA/acyl-ACP dehydrogenase [Actinobacteria bacterium]|nr:acyl-CoA/acyl-ACP dehydrogenase [Actinomycetota bacterium]MBU1943649.1 acyl-CoA/acyl-ACP dehydrogenase [Actinomycetota bacterium]MBU2686207.1 acyl-CoA/acyl-ACP dehydrogenase [Actinomycetota bacterium]